MLQYLACLPRAKEEKEKNPKQPSIFVSAQLGLHNPEIHCPNQLSVQLPALNWGEGRGGGEDINKQLLYSQKAWKLCL